MAAVDGGDDAVAKGGVKDDARLAAWGPGHLPFAVMEKTRRRSRCGVGEHKLHLRSAKCGLPVGADSEHVSRCFFYT